MRSRTSAAPARLHFKSHSAPSTGTSKILFCGPLARGVSKKNTSLHWSRPSLTHCRLFLHKHLASGTREALEMGGERRTVRLASLIVAVSLPLSGCPFTDLLQGICETESEMGAQKGSMMRALVTRGSCSPIPFTFFLFWIPARCLWKKSERGSRKGLCNTNLCHGSFPLPI